MRIFICRGFIQFSEFIILFICCCSCFNFCSSTDIITVSHPLTDPENITSSNNDFQLGFFSPVDTTNRYVGIWYSDMISEKSVLWVANREKPLSDSSGTLAISEDGNLVILNGEKVIIWSSNVSTSLANSSAQLLDSGNLVLLDKATGRTVWESFQHPTDSIVQGMRLSSNRKKQEGIVLNSWKSSSDPSVGSFYAGVGVGTVAEVFGWNGSLPYWRSGPWNNQKFIGVEHMASQYFDRFTVEDNKEEGSVSVSFSYTSNSSISYMFLDPQGTFRRMYWDQTKPESEFTWASIGSPCDVYGKCGAFGSCNPKDSLICTCLRGFEPRDVEEWKSGSFSGGCVRRTPLQCGTNDSSMEGKTRDGFLKLTTMKVPDFINLTPNLDDECESQCYNDCSCTAYVETVGIGCMLWNGSLIDLQKFSSNGVDLYVRLADSELGFTGNKRNLKVLISASVIAGLIAVAILIYLVRLLIVKQRGTRTLMQRIKWKYFSVNSTTRHTADQDTLEELPLFKFEELAIATESFSIGNKLGQGGFGPVFKGKLQDGQEIAVKRLSRSSGQGIEEFMNEVMVISKLQHRNLVRLLGCCVEGDEKMLVYEYMPNKSLDAVLFDLGKKELLPWRRRFNIIEGIARGLLYLHRDSRLKIIHRDLKTSNILLDEDLIPKISDFGMARIFLGGEDQVNTARVVGTYGYMAPEYAMEGIFSEKSDVFSFGVLLLEIISGRRNTSFYNDLNSLSLIKHAWKLWTEDNIEALIETTIPYTEFRNEILRCINVAFLCVQEFPADRPTISTVLSMLTSEIAHLPEPKQPAFTHRPTPTERPHLERIANEFSSNDVTIISGQRNTSFYVDEDSWSLLAYAWKLWNGDNIAALIDQSASYRDFEDDVLHVGLLCVQEFAAERPTAVPVLSRLRSETVHFAEPKQPAFTQTQMSIETDLKRCSINGPTVTAAEGR